MSIISWGVLAMQIIGLIASLASSIMSGSTWTMALVWTVVGTMWVTSATFGIGNWMIVNFLQGMIPDWADWVVDAIINGSFLQQLGAKRLIFVISIVESVLAFPINLLLLWIVNTIILQISILIQCKKFNGDSLSTAASSALAGAIPTSVHLLVWGILASIPIIIGQILTAIEALPYTFTFGLIHVPTIIAILFNLGFGAIGNKVAIDNACPAAPPTPPAAPAAPEGSKEGFRNSHSHSHSHANYGPYDRCRCMCCPVCNKL